MKKKILLVAGYNYAGRYDYAESCKRRMNYLLFKNPSWISDKSVEFYLFSFEKGTITKNSIIEGQRVWETINDRFTPITKTLYDGKAFQKADTNVLSITDMYEFIYHVGQTEPSSIYEVSIISHANAEGPILVNSYQREPYKPNGSQQNLRDPWDKDGRSKDFNTKNLSATNRAHFTAAFAPNGYFWLWGCTFPRLVYTILYQTFSRNKKSRVAQYKDTDNIKFSYRQDQANAYYAYIPFFFPPTKTDGTVQRTDLKFTRTFGQIKDLFKALTLNTYAGLLSFDTFIPCRSAFIGTWSEPEKSPVKKQYRVEAIYREKPPFPFIIDFFKIHLGLAEDPEKRGFAVFDPFIMNQWWLDLQSSPTEL